MIRVDLRMSDIVKRVLSRIPVTRSVNNHNGHEAVYGPFDALNTSRCQFQHIEPTIAHKTVVCGCSDSESIVKEWRVLHCVALKPLGAEFQHDFCQRHLSSPIHDRPA